MTAKQKETQREFSTCFEGIPFVEMMGKMMGRQGVGSLCAEMMQKIIDQKEPGSGFDCAKIMEKMMTMCADLQKEDENAAKEQGSPDKSPCIDR